MTDLQQEQILPRQEQIVRFVGDEGSVSITDLAQRLNVTEQTIRRDIRRLEDLGLVARYHGGAATPQHRPNLINKALSERELINVNEKEAIARAVADLIEEGSTVFITIGTTVEKIADALAASKKQLRVITDSLRVAARLYQTEGVEVLIPSGALRASNGGIEGPKTINDLAEFRADYVVTSIGAIEEDGSLLDFNLTEVMAARCMIKNAKKFILASDNSKFTAAASVRLGHLRDVDHFVTDVRPCSSVMQIIDEFDVDLVIAK